jgi:hypothetical protein
LDYLRREAIPGGDIRGGGMALISATEFGRSSVVNNTRVDVEDLVSRVIQRHDAPDISGKND